LGLLDFHGNVMTSSYDEGTMWQAPNIQDVATEVGQCLTKGDPGSAFRVVARFLEFYDKADWPTRERMVNPRPDPTGSERYGALLRASSNTPARPTGSWPRGGSMIRNSSLTNSGSILE